MRKYDICGVNCEINEYSTVSSTNDIAKEMAKAGAKEGTVISAESQTAGKGRLSRRFYSPKKSGIYMSIILRPEISSEDSPILTAAAAAAVRDAIEKVCGKKSLIKWVNDLLSDNKKICGILTESAVKDSGILYAVVGIGINLYENSFPEEIKDIAGGIFEKEPDSNIKDKLILEILYRFFEIYKNLPNKDFMNSYREHSAVLGKKITYYKGEKLFEGTAEAIDDNARLTVKLNNGETDILAAGEVSIKY